MAEEKKRRTLREMKRDTEEKSGGIKCPKCHCRMGVYYTKQRKNSVYRVRICRHCGHMRPTTEI